MTEAVSKHAPREIAGRADPSLASQTAPRERSTRVDSRPAGGAPAPAGRLKASRRKILQISARLAPRITAHFLARRYLSSAVHVDVAAWTARAGVSAVAVDSETTVLQFRPDAPCGTRVLLSHGHDGSVRQFARLVRALLRAGVEVDALVLPGHLRPEQQVCSLSTIVGAIQRCNAALGPYDGIVGHCISANALLHALSEGLVCPRLVFISAPVEFSKLIRLAGRQYGIGGRCLDYFVEEVSQLGAPYTIDRPWRRMAAERPETLLVVHARHDYAAPVQDVLELETLWPDAHAEIFEQGDHNSILNMNAPTRSIAEFLTAGRAMPGAGPLSHDAGTRAH
ncbi:hypothetical protein M4578_02960 [Salipiger sp. P9]|uniref:alpha/beta hydrolase n=1 Tax=Salipiger pentaromativorans TaxID=2943193 RepID=UPI0021580B6A|nr:hypothetical protein [Salipiger pentaromativorans]MCR8546774.1 hypothetical protein [Salipiger pentaromativorans]